MDDAKRIKLEDCKNELIAQLRFHQLRASQIHKTITDMDESEEDSASDDSAPAIYMGGKGKGKGKFMLANKEDPHIVEQRRRIEYIVDRFESEPTTVRITKEDYVHIKNRMDFNISHLTSHARNPLKKIRTCKFEPVIITVKVPVIKKGEDPNGLDKYWQCMGCNEVITDQYVPTLRCGRCKMHPDCAAFLIHIVGKRDFYNCLAKFCVFNRNRELAKGINCRHVTDDDLVQASKEALKVLSS